MKLVFLLFLIVIVAIIVFIFSSKKTANTKKQKEANWKPIQITSLVVFLLVCLLGIGLYSSAIAPDTQCTKSHSTTLRAPTSFQTALDYFAQGNYDYDIGKCQQAVASYTRAIILNPNYPQAYNNRAYTYMRMQDYKDALPDLNKAIQINPNYIQALMNRGDIHNYYYQIDRQAAIADYRRVIALTGPNGGNTSVCGHLFLAKHNEWNMGAVLDYFSGAFSSCK